MTLSSTLKSVQPSRFRALTDRPLPLIFAISFLTLYIELVVIRWLASEIQVFSWLKNLPLLVAFLGLGLGALTPSASRRLGLQFVWLFVGFAVFLIASEPLQLEHVRFWDPAIKAFHNPYAVGAWPDQAPAPVVVATFLLVVALVSALLLRIFVLLGRVLGACMNTAKPLTAYSANLLGSLAGVVVFTVLSYLQTPPIAWLAVAFAAMLPLVPLRWTTALPIVPTLALVLVYSLRPDVLWSPYYRVGFKAIEGWDPPIGYTTTVNRHYHQQPFNLSDRTVAAHPSLTHLRASKDFPFSVAERNNTVAILGAGTGNDIAAALRYGAQRIVAVEIDAVHVELGRQLHGEQPYANPNVEVVINDARAWMRQTDERFDVVSFGAIDSYTMLSSMSSIRLESYLYTVESIRDAIQRLKPDGIAAMGFLIGPYEWQGQRLFNVIEQATGSAPVAIEMTDQGIVFVFGPGLRREVLTQWSQQTGYPIVTDRFAGSSVRAATDDWPFLYLNPNELPLVYFYVLLALLAVSYLSIRRSLGADARVTALNGQMFLMGAGFLLIETKSIAELALLFGSTWVVNAAVFCAILAMALLANLIVARWARPHLPTLYGLLLLSLLAGWAMPTSVLNSFGLLERAAIGSALSALPVAFSGVVFATAFRLAPKASTALGWNLFGAMVGGVIEASSMWLGIKGLGLVAAAIYMVSWLALTWAQRVRPQEVPAPLTPFDRARP